jgi:hypothetical protein
MTFTKRLAALSCSTLVLACGAASADHTIITRGTVLFSNISSGPLAGIPAGTPVVYRQVVAHHGTEVTPGEVFVHQFDFAQTSITFGTLQLFLDPGANPPVFAFENDWTDDSGSDGIETRPDLVALAGTPYQMRTHFHNILGDAFESHRIADNAGFYSGSMFHHLTWTIYSGVNGMLVTLGDIEIIPGVGCDTLDFNADGLYPDTLDIEDFLSVFAGGACSNDPNCGSGTNDIDFNNDGLFPDVSDVEALLNAFAGAPCP